MELRKVFIACLVYLIILSGFPSSAQYLTKRPDWAGIWFNMNSKPQDVKAMGIDFAGIGDRITWSETEPQKGLYDFSAIKKRLEDAAATNTYYYFVLWTGPHSPKWIYQNGVPNVQTREGNFPYYLNENYQNYIIAYFDTLAAKIAAYGPDIASKLAFIQPGFGSTGDRQLYKGTPFDTQYNLSKDDYVAFMKKMSAAFTAAFGRHENTKDVMFLWNIDDYDGSDPGGLAGNPELKQGEMIYAAWMKENYNCQLRKQQFTVAIGYMSPNEMDQDNEQRENFFGKSGRWGGNPEFVRGEFNDAKWATTPMAKLNETLHYYWTSISGVDRGLDGWECKEVKSEYKDAYAFSNRYSFYKRAESSPVAFVVLRDVLDYSDKSRFPEDQYGEASRTNQGRIDKILADYSFYGAGNDDNNAVKKQSQADYLLNVTGYNDCTWNVIARNYQRFITQIDANETSSGYWRVGITPDQPYGRFARGFDVEKEKNAMYFDVDDQFFLGNRQKNKNGLKIKIIYYTSEGGSWKLLYHATDSTMKTALNITNQTGQGWLSKEVLIEDALLNNGGPRGADLVLQNTGNTNCKFHLIELERDVVIPKNDSIKVEGVSINSCPSGELFQSEVFQLNASITPSYAGNHTVMWSSSDPLVASVDTEGMVKAISEGNAIIKISTNDGGFTDECHINVVRKTVSVYGVTISQCPLTILSTSKTHQLIANVAPADATDKSVIWISSNPEVASVDEKGLVSALSQGSIKITVTTNDGGYKSTCNIGVMGTATTTDLYKLKNTNVKIYPNPVTDKLYVDFSKRDANREIRIFNYLGQLIFQEFATDLQKLIDINKLNGNGLLAVQIKSGEHFSVHKVRVI